MATTVLFIVPYPVKRAPSQRFRVELYEGVLQEAGIAYTIAPFLDETTYNIIYKSGSVLQKAIGIIKAFGKRISILFQAPQYDFVFIHREAAPIGPPIIEWLLAKLLRKKIIYDFDDAIWIPNTSKENRLAAGLKCFWKVKHIIRMAYAITPGNAYLASYALQFNQNVIQIPTCVDVVHGHRLVKKHDPEKKVVIGWTGSHSTLFYLDFILPILRELQTEYSFTFLVIADKKPDITLDDWEFIAWNAQTEQEDLLRMDIGIMPLQRDAWSEGKCGFKLIQYLSCGIPAVADPIGVNKDIVVEGVTGYLCYSQEDWKNKLAQLIQNPILRQQMGAAGRDKIVKEYSIQSQQEKFLELFSRQTP